MTDKERLKIAVKALETLRKSLYGSFSCRCIEHHLFIEETLKKIRGKK